MGLTEVGSFAQARWIFRNMVVEVQRWLDDLDVITDTFRYRVRKTPLMPVNTLANSGVPVTFESRTNLLRARQVLINMVLRIQQPFGRSHCHI